MVVFLRAAATKSAEELAREEGCLKRETSELEAARHERDRELLAKLQHLRDVRDGLQRETATLRHEEAPISAETARLQEHAAELLKEAADHAAKTQDLTERAAEVRRGEKERYDAHVAAMPDLENSIAHCLEMQDRCACGCWPLADATSRACTCADWGGALSIAWPLLKPRVDRAQASRPARGGRAEHKGSEGGASCCQGEGGASAASYARACREGRGGASGGQAEE